MVVKEHTEFIEVTQDEKCLLILALDFYHNQCVKDQVEMLKVGKYNSPEYESITNSIKFASKLVEKINKRNEVLL